MKHLVLTSIVAIVMASDASAQVTAQPPTGPSRPYRGLFGGARPQPNRTRQELTMAINVLGGYDDNLSPIGQSATFLGSTGQSGYTGYGDASWRYFVGHSDRSFDVQGSGFVNTYQNIGLTPTYGGDIAVTGRTKIGRDTELTGRQMVRYAPYYALGLFGGFQNPSPTNQSAFIAGRTWSRTTFASLDHEWTRRSKTIIQYSLNSQQTKPILDHHSHGGGATFEHSFGRSMTLRGTYQRNESNLQNRLLYSRIVQNGFIGGGTYAVQVSRRRTLSLTGHGGAEYIDRHDSVHVKYWSPIITAAARVDVGRTWSAFIDYRQSLNVLPAPVFTANGFFSHSFTVGADGFIGPRIQLVFNAGYTDGALGGGVPGSGSGVNSSSYTGYTGTGQLTFQMTRWWLALVNFNHYQSILSGQGGAFLGVPGNIHRNSVRAGFAWQVPLFGYFGGNGPTTGGRRRGN